jgi:hypothetical protein
MDSSFTGFGRQRQLGSCYRFRRTDVSFVWMKDKFVVVYAMVSLTNSEALLLDWFDALSLKNHAFAKSLPPAISRDKQFGTLSISLLECSLLLRYPG